VLDAIPENTATKASSRSTTQNVLRIAPFSEMGARRWKLIKTFGGKRGFEKAVHEMQDALYQEAG
jgi:type I restriction enzyme R subunit